MRRTSGHSTDHNYPPLHKTLNVQEHFRHRLNSTFCGRQTRSTIKIEKKREKYFVKLTQCNFVRIENWATIGAQSSSYCCSGRHIFGENYIQKGQAQWIPSGILLNFIHDFGYTTARCTMHVHCQQFRGSGNFRDLPLSESRRKHVKSCLSFLLISQRALIYRDLHRLHDN